MTGFLWSDDSEEFFQKVPPKNTKRRSSAQEPELAGSADEPLSVSQLNANIKRALDASFQAVWIVGEVSNLTRSGAGHVYFSLKDATNQISAVLWRSTRERIRLELKEGMSVLCYGRVDVYGPRGSYQIVVQKIEEQGVGAQQIAFRKLYAKLEQEGLFESERKRELPPFPKRIGFVTSPSGAAIHDFLQVLRRRWPLTSVLIIPSKVQGEGAALEIATGIAIANQIAPALDLLVVGRGGGSTEDLWAFNEEIVVRALAASEIPTVSAVGHEIDVTLSDLVADVRALTPSEAAELVVPHCEEIRYALQQAKQRITKRIDSQIRLYETKLESLTRRPIFENPERLIELPSQQLDELERMVTESIDRQVREQEQRLEIACAKLDAMNPLRILARGYSATSNADDGSLLTRAEQAQVGMRIRTVLAEGELLSDIVSIKRG